MLSEAVRNGFLQFCDRETDPRSFETWVCAAQGLEGEIGHGPYVDLISADYRGRDIEGARDWCATLLEQHHPGSLARYRVRRIVRSMLDDDSAVIPGLRRPFATTATNSSPSNSLGSTASSTAYRRPIATICGMPLHWPSASLRPDRI